VSSSECPDVKKQHDFFLSYAGFDGGQNLETFILYGKLAAKEFRSIH